MKFFGLLPQKSLGIDIGTSSVKVVELSGWAGKKTLESYGEISAEALYKKPFRTFDKSTLLLSTDEIVKAVKAIIKEANIKTKEVSFSIPDYSTFFTSFDLPPMTKEEIPQAVKAEAKRHVPIPLGEVILDWQVLNQPRRRKKEKIKILLVAVPNEVINQYQRIAFSLELKLLAMEAEVFGLIRSLTDRRERGVVGIIDIGARSTTCSIIENRTLMISRSFDISGDALTERVAKGLSLDREKAEEVKMSFGIITPKEEKNGNVSEILDPLVEIAIREIEKIFRTFRLKENKEVKKILLAGGTVLMPGLLGRFREYFKDKDVEIANPFTRINYPPILEDTLKKMGPSYAIAVGMALRELE